MITRGAKRIPVKLYGGLLAENASQALARDVFSDILLRLESLGHNTIMHVHDEVVIEAKKDDADQILCDVLSAMSAPISWIPDLPLEAEGKVTERYEK
jgi:DNA polymerase